MEKNWKSVSNILEIGKTNKKWMLSRPSPFCVPFLWTWGTLLAEPILYTETNTFEHKYIHHHIHTRSWRDFYLSEVVKKPVTKAHFLGREVSGAFWRINVDFLCRRWNWRQWTGPAEPGIFRRRRRRRAGSKKLEGLSSTREVTEREGDAWMEDKQGRICKHGWERRERERGQWLRNWWF